MDCIVPKVENSWTRLSNFTFTFIHNSTLLMLCFPGLTFSIQSREQYMTRPLCTVARTKDSDTKKFVTTSHTLSTFSNNEAWTLVWLRWFFGTLVPHLLGLLAFPIKSLSLAPATSSLNFLACHAGSSLSLYSYDSSCSGEANWKIEWKQESSRASPRWLRPQMVMGS